MITTREEIKKWFLEGQRKGATHLLIVSDTFEWETRPVYVMPVEDVREKEKEAGRRSTDSVAAVYSLRQNMASQLEETAPHHYD